MEYLIYIFNIFKEIYYKLWIFILWNKKIKYNEILLNKILLNNK